MKELKDYLAYHLNENDVRCYDSEILRLMTSLQYSQVAEFKLRGEIKGIKELIYDIWKSN